MDGWVIWVIVACAFGVGEIVTTSFFLAPFGIGAVAAAIAAAVGAPAVVAWAVFLIVSILMLTVVRPIARAHLRTPPLLRTGTAALVGRRVMVVERIANDESVGCVRIDGEIWTARAYDDDQVIEAGTPVHIVEIRGATALVSD